MNKYASILAGVISWGLTSVQAAPLCEQKSILDNAKAYSELLIPETEFNDKQVKAAIKHFRHTLPELIESTKKTKKIKHDPMYYIKTPKATTILEGHHYLQNYRIAVLEAKLAEDNKKKKRKKALKAVEKAKQTFCDFYEMNMLGAD